MLVREQQATKHQMLSYQPRNCFPAIFSIKSPPMMCENIPTEWKNWLNLPGDVFYVSFKDFSIIRQGFDCVLYEEDIKPYSVEEKNGTCDRMTNWYFSGWFAQNNRNMTRKRVFFSMGDKQQEHKKNLLPFGSVCADIMRTTGLTHEFSRPQF